MRLMNEIFLERAFVFAGWPLRTRIGQRPYILRRREKPSLGLLLMDKAISWKSIIPT
jgi:hypothetical protein